MTIVTEEDAKLPREELLSKLQRVTLPDLEWLQLGFHTMTEDQQIAWLMQQLAKDFAGALNPPLTAIQAANGRALLNKLKADKKAMEVTTKPSVYSHDDAELDRRIDNLLAAREEARIARPSGGASAPEQPKKAH